MHRITKLLIAAAVGVGVLFGGASPAGAVGETIGACLLEELEITEIAVALAEGEELNANLASVVDKHPEYLEAAEDLVVTHDGDVSKIEKEAEERYEACQEAPNPLVPEINEVIWGGLGFLVVFIFLAKFGFPQVKKAMDERTERIRSQIDDAERQKAEADMVLEQYQRQLNDAKAESARIIEEARQAADSMRRDLQAKAESDAVAIRERAQADVDQMIATARADLQTQVSEMSIQLAEKVVGRNLDRETNLAIIESYIRELETQG